MSSSVNKSLNKARKHIKTGNISEAERVYKSLLKKFPKNKRANDGLKALQLLRGGQPEQPLDTEVQNLVTLYERNQFEQVVEQAAALSQTFPKSAILYELRGAAHTGLSQHEAALRMLRKALLIDPNSANTNNNMGNILRSTGDLDAAIGHYSMATRLQPDFALAHNNLGVTHWHKGNSKAARESYAAAIQLSPDYADAHNNLGYALNKEGDLAGAVASYRKAVKYEPGFAEAHNNLGNALQDLGALDEAITCFQTALHLSPNRAAIHYNMGNAMQELGNRPKAVASYAFACELEPDYQSARSQKLHQLSHICDWEMIALDRSLLPSLGTTDQEVDPFNMLALEDAPERHLKRSRLYTANKYPQPQLPLEPPPLSKPKRLRIGYFSADFQKHPSMYLMAGMLEAHDREKVEVYAYTYGPDSADEMRHRAVAAVDEFKEVRNMTDFDLARLARRDKIDIAIHVNGHTQNSRTGVFAYRAAPVQINYLGYPGTLGADFIDYIISDKRIVPDGFETFYTEKMIYLPHTYQPTDNQRVVSDRSMTRRDMGLPDTGFVFCCFNNNYKITAAEFAIWMRLLAQVEGSVLWLLKSNPWAEQNLRRALVTAGLSQDRLVFAEKLPQPQHLARQRLADLFLDTFKYNAHTTTSDALWIGLPVVTMMGRGFAARVAGSLLSAVEMPELITDSATAYERLALELAQNPSRLTALRQKLADKRDTAPLFDTARYTRHLEAGYQQAYDRFFEGQKPATIIL